MKGCPLESRLKIKLLLRKKMTAHLQPNRNDNQILDVRADNIRGIKIRMF